MTTAELLSALRRNSVKLWVDGDQLRCSAPSGALTLALRDELARQKADIVSFLNGAQIATRQFTHRIEPVSEDRNLPLSFAQQRIWLADQLEPGNPAYNMPQALKIGGHLSAVGLDHSISEIVKRHKVLRSTFTSLDGQPLQNIAPPEQLKLSLVDLGGLQGSESEPLIKTLAEEEGQRSFDLRTDRMLRARLLLVTPDERVLLLSMHHVASDMWSMSILVNEVTSLYMAYSRGAQSTLEDLAVQYADFATWQRKWMDDERVQRHVRYWKDKLKPPLPRIDIAEAPPSQVPTRLSRLHYFQLSDSLSASLKKLFAEEAVTPFMLLLAGFKALLHRYTGLDDILLSSQTAGRNRTELESLIGFFINQLVFRTDLSGDLTFRELIARVRDVSLEAFDHQDLPFDRLLEDLSLDREAAGVSVSRIVFGLQALPQKADALAMGELSFKYLGDVRTRTRTDLVLLMWERQDLIEGSFEYNTDIFSDQEIASMAGHYEQVLQAMADAPESRLSSLPIQPIRVHRDIAAPASTSIDELYKKSNLTMNQMLFWLGQKLQPDAPLFNMVIVYQIPGEIDPGLFNKAFRLVLGSSDALRTVITETDGVPVQTAIDFAGYEMEYLDFSSDEDPHLALNAWVEQRKRRRLDFEICLFDSALIKLSGGLHAWYTNQHHIICDAWSTGLTFERQALFYDRLSNRRRGRKPVYPAFAEYASVERALNLSDSYREARAYWEQKLSIPSEPVRFYGRRPESHLVHVKRVSHDLDYDQGAMLRSKAQSGQLYSGSVNATLANIVLALLSAYLHRISGNSAIVVGAAMHNRRTSKMKESIGLFMRFVPLRIQIEPSDTFVTLVGKTKSEFLAARTHAEYTVVSSHSQPAYGVLLNYITASYGKFNGQPIKAEWVHSGSGAESFALHVHDLDSSGAFTLEFDFDTEVFDPSLQLDAINHFNNLINAFLEDTNRRISDLSLLTPQEARQLLIDFNSTRMEWRREVTIAAILQTQTANTPDAIAVVFKDHFVGYQSLDELAMRIAAKIANSGIGPEKLVALLMDRSVELLAGMMASFKLGAGYLPLDPALPPQRLAQLIARSGASVVLMGGEVLTMAGDFLSDLQGAFEEASLEELPELLTIEELLQPGLTTNPIGPPAGALANLAYVIYTSGSTGVPKGAMIEQAGMINHLYAKISALSLTGSDIVAETASQSFDISVWQFLAALVVGGEVVILEDDVTHDPRRLMDAVRAAEVTVLEIVPAVLGEIVLEEGAAAAGLAAPSSLRWLMLTGEALAPDLCRRWLAAHSEIPIMNAYGPTECSDDVAHYTVELPPNEGELYVPIGKPVGNLKLYTVDDEMVPLPYGMPGELLVGGIGVGRGYLGDPATTAAAFIPDSYSGAEGSRLYKTGDMVRNREQNGLEFLGRRDYQIKVRGNRIELGEIEAEIGAHPGVREAVVLVQEQSPDLQQLIAYFVGNGDLAPAGWELRGYLQHKLPEYMVPETLIMLDEFPRSSNGKIDRRALRLQGRTLQQSSVGYVGPRDMLEVKLLAIWQDVLGARDFGVTSNFFELGGHSLMAVRLMAQIQRWLGRDLPLADFFQGPTIEQLAEAIRKQASGIEPSPLVPIQPHGSERPFFCIHPGSGDIFYYIGLSRHMPQDRPFYGLQDPKLYLDCDPFTPLPEMAAQYIKAVRSVQSEGPYMLGGWSFGGHVAFEMAQQLRAQGHSVGLLAVIDTGTQEFLESRFADADSAKLLAIIACETAPEAERNVQELSDELRTLNESKRQVEFVVKLLKEHNKLAFLEHADNYIHRALDLFQTRISVMKCYSASPYPGQITLLQASEKLAGVESDSGDPSWGWSKLSNQAVRIVSIPGNHATLGREPHVRVLANRLTQLVVEAEATSLTKVLAYH
jgi:amino acid adenylation domain-containing protein